MSIVFQENTIRSIIIVSAVLRMALTAELSSPGVLLARFVFRKENDAKPRRALTRTALTNRSSRSPLHSDSALRVGACVTWTLLNSAVMWCGNGQKRQSSRFNDENN